MNTEFVLLVGLGVLLAAGLGYCAWRRSRLLQRWQQQERERDALKSQYDQLRKENFDLSQRLEQSQSQEKTYRAAYEDWKSRYALLEERHVQLKRETEERDVNDTAHVRESLKEHSKDAELERLRLRVTDLEGQLNQRPVTPSPESKIVADLKSVLDQHLAIISKIIGDEKMEQYTQGLPSDPIHLIKGMDERVCTTLRESGYRTFEQIANAPRKELRKWMTLFEDIDDKLIASWPYQAEAIINAFEMEKE
ncbi:MAG: hypothetical protein JPMHGGIA_01250 [Saprospiraceae bacterium]|jgi:cell division protein FtsL|nr:hypothetical protein [Saprospiraceae bacterium]